jgi:hypothetical protein
VKAVCARCQKIEEGYTHTDRGWLCERCTKSTVRVLVVHVMGDGAVFVEHQKQMTVVSRNAKTAPARAASQKGA